MKQFSILYRILAFVFMACMTWCVHAASFMPLIHNFMKGEYNAALQNWSLTQAADGTIFVGNGQGLLEYDGYTWQLTRLPSNGVARSVLADGERVYVGSYQEFGYMERNELGELQYISLWPSGYKPHEDEIWNIVKDSSGKIYFQSFAGWFVFDGKKVTSHFDDKMLPLYFHEIGGKIYTQIQNGDYYRVENESFIRLFSRSEVDDDNVVACLPWHAGSLLLCTQMKGLFLYDGEKVVPFRTDADVNLRSDNLNRATLIKNDSIIVIGTILGGIYGISPQGELKWHYDMGNRLINNCVLALMSDSCGDVWAALDTGLALVSTSSPFTLLTPDNNTPSIGMVYGLNVCDDLLYIATNQAAWQYSFATGMNRLISGCDGQNWHVTNIDGELLLGNNMGMRVIHPSTASATPIANSGQSSTCLRKCQLNGQEILLESSYYNMRVYKKENGRWTYSHDVDGFHAPVGEFDVDHVGNIWASHMSHGLFQIRLTPDLRSATVTRHEHLGQDSSLAVSHVMKIRGRMVFSQNHHLYTYDDMSRTIVPYHELDSVLTDFDVNMAAAVDDNTFWVATPQGFNLISFDGSHYHLENAVSSQFFGLECNDNKNNVYIHDGVAYFNLNNGVGRYDMRQKVQMPEDTTKHLRIRRVTTTGRNVADKPLPVKAEKNNPARAFTFVNIVLSYPDYSFQPLVFNFSLQGGGLDHHSQSHEPQVSYSALGYGDYHFRCDVTTLDGKLLDSIDYYFSRPRPFFASWWAWMCYVALLIAGVYALLRYRTHKTEEQLRRQFEDKRLQQDLKVLERDKIIAEQKQQLLEAQLSDKTREVASMALDAMARNRAIDNIRDSLREKRRKGSISQSDMAAMLRQLGENADNDNFWEVYQNNFNLIHHNFFKHLKQEYPLLTPSDLRFCALLRLNLSTKEIAQFTGLTVRGVEGARYRLRKKLNLPEGRHLAEFLMEYE